MGVGDPDPTDANSEEWQQGSFPGVKKVNISCPGTGLLGSPLSGHGLDGRAIDCPGPADTKLDCGSHP